VFVKSKQQDNWVVFDNKEEILALIDLLVEKGIKEKRLKFNFKRAIEKQILFDNNKDATISELEETKEAEQNYNLGNCADIIINFEIKFSEYLKNYDKEWECEEMRSKWVN
jgi:hypothetical protein